METLRFAEINPHRVLERCFSSKRVMEEIESLLTGKGRLADAEQELSFPL
jgi:hypothetical protein